MNKITECRSCKSKKLKEFFDLGEQPLANSLLSGVNQPEKSYPLALCWCEDCNLAQLTYTADPKELFSNYVWVTGTAKGTQEFSEIFCERVLTQVGDMNKGYILEVASNDGTFLIPFQKRGYEVLGVDPARNIVDIALKNNVPTKCAFFDDQVAKEIAAERGPAKVVFARNVLPHVANTHEFVKGLAVSMNEESLLVLEVHYVKKIIEELQYDSIYHEHLCYFTIKSIEKLLEQHGLFIYDIGTSPISGGSVVLHIKKCRTAEKPIVQEYRDNESRLKLNELQSWELFAIRAYLHRENLVRILKEQISQGKKIVGWGASARSSTLLNFCKVNTDLISEIVDLNKLKQGLFTAGTHIPIKCPKEVMAKNPDCVVILAWNFAEEIMEQLKRDFGFRGECIVPLPHAPKVISLDTSTADMINTEKKDKETAAAVNNFRLGQIEGVKVIPLKKFPDVRGTIMHGVRKDNLLNDFGEVYFKKLYSGIINGWHVHETLILNYICVHGMVRIVMCDMRNNSPTKNVVQEVFVGEDNYVLVHIPTGIANATAVINGNFAIICNVASEPHNPNIKYRRIDPHSGEIGYDWNKKDF